MRAIIDMMLAVLRHVRRVVVVRVVHNGVMAVVIATLGVV
jgi:hypothetical protein